MNAAHPATRRTTHFNKQVSPMRKQPKAPPSDASPLQIQKTTVSVRTGVHAGLTKVNHNQARLNGLTIRTGIRVGGGKLNHNQSRL